ncbi:hypothetical protein LZ24_01000 [Desulfobotulus alkaliphilus]|uniref:Uncharacterized protein n=1 Tax=Desulfobotulus alkaliphilus TaxID=622671 RepID=A0A562RZ53_9BACT|nr:hypothetical protein [Desulfobotulus alkaliphilus]TWI74395.1 hypothetical protein LZ24_01000 [Desulfobotulus alkaliphilus]
MNERKGGPRWLEFLSGFFRISTRQGKKTPEEFNGQRIEELADLQEKGDGRLVEEMFAAGPGMSSWAMKLQQRFLEVLEEKETYIADKGALPYPEAWIRLAFKFQALRCIRAGQEELIPAIRNGLDHLACFQNVSPADREAIMTVERYRDEIRSTGVSPGEEDAVFLSDGTSLKEVLKGYSKALPVFNRYHDAIEERKKICSMELDGFMVQVKKHAGSAADMG